MGNDCLDAVPSHPARFGALHPSSYASDCLCLPELYIQIQAHLIPNEMYRKLRAPYLSAPPTLLESVQGEREREKERERERSYYSNNS